MDVHKVIKKPIITEKSHRMAEEDKKYSFEVVREATKKDVARAVEELYKGTKVGKVAIANALGKPVTWRSRGARPTKGRRKSVKKAIVTLDKGKIDIFEE